MAARSMTVLAATVIAAQVFFAPGAPAGENPAVQRNVRVLVTMRGRGDVPEMVERRIARLRRSFREISAVALEVPAARVAELQADPDVLRVEADPPRWASSTLDGIELKPLAKNGLYGLVSTKATKAHLRGAIGAGVVVCVADTGIDAEHPDIAAAYRGGIDAVDDDNDPNVGPDANLGGHGTHVAATIVAALNGQGVRGVAYGAELYFARVLGPDESFASDVMAGVRHLVVERGCRVVNLSLGGDSGSATEEAFYDEMRNVHGALIVAAAGNDDGPVGFPAAYRSVVAVAAVDQANRRAGFSNVGPQVDIAAPGVLVLSAVPRDSGTESKVVGRKSYPSIGMLLAGQTDGLTGKLVNCGLGNTPGAFPAAVDGGIALVKRGFENFSVKVQNAMDAGALAVVVYNNEAADLAGTLVQATARDQAPWIPAVGVSAASGAVLLRQVGKPATVVNALDSWGVKSGTSMATPHVAGVAALVFGIKPWLGPGDVEDILESTARDLGANGRDPQFGAGLVDADAATREAARR